MRKPREGVLYFARVRTGLFVSGMTFGKARGIPETQELKSPKSTRDKTWQVFLAWLGDLPRLSHKNNCCFFSYQV